MGTEGEQAGDQEQRVTREDEADQQARLGKNDGADHQQSPRASTLNEGVRAEPWNEGSV
jgi:hypothetical protein